jgi:hypothetical protein
LLKVFAHLSSYPTLYPDHQWLFPRKVDAQEQTAERSSKPIGGEPKDKGEAFG